MEENNFFPILNSYHPNITLKSCIAEKSIDSFDVTYFKGPQFNSKGILNTKVYFKQTDTHELLHKSSYHPKHIFKGKLLGSTEYVTTQVTLIMHATFSLHTGYAQWFLRTIIKKHC